MPVPSKPGPAFFLGLELATDQLRASIVDESLELVGVECVDFDNDIPEYQFVTPLARWCCVLHLAHYSVSRTQGGIFTTPGDAYTTPVEMWVKALGMSLFNFFLQFYFETESNFHRVDRGKTRD